MPVLARVCWGLLRQIPVQLRQIPVQLRQIPGVIHRLIRAIAEVCCPSCHLCGQPVSTMRWRYCVNIRVFAS